MQSLQMDSLSVCYYGSSGWPILCSSADSYIAGAGGILLPTAHLTMD